MNPIKSTLRAFLFLLLLIPLLGNAQLSLTPGLSAYQLASMLAGPGVQIINPVITSPINYYSSFTATGTNLGLSNGILLTTGDNSIAIGPNNQNGAATLDNNPGDATLQAIAGVSTFDAAVLEFDFIPQNDTIKFRYVFASEEYPEYVCSTYNDLFGFFISGPSITGTQNIAIIPGTTIPVAINTVNNGTSGTNSNPNTPCNLSYPNLYVDNTTSNYIQYDGYTTVLTAMAIVVPCQTYHLKIVIADAGDADYDSGVFLEAGSLSSTPLVNAGVDASFCSGTIYQLGIPPAAGWSYTWSPSTNLSNPTISNPTANFINNGNVGVTVAYVLTGTNGTCILKDSIALTSIPIPSSSFTPINKICAGDTVSILYTGTALSTANYIWNYPGGTILQGTSQGPLLIQYPIAGNYIISLNVNYNGCPSSQTNDNLQVLSNPISSFLLPDSICIGENIIVENTGTNSTQFTYTWNFGIGSSIVNGTGGNPYTVNWLNAGMKYITLTLTNQICTDIYIDSIYIKPLPTASISSPNSICSSDTLEVNFNGTANITSSYTWNTGGMLLLSGSGIGPLLIKPTKAGIDSVAILVNQNGCVDSAVHIVSIIAQPIATFTSPTQICKNDSIQLIFTGVSPAGSFLHWNLTGSSPSSSSSGSTIIATYNNSGSFPITLQITNGFCTDSIADTIVVNPLPLAEFTSGDVCNGVPISIQNNSTISSGNINSTSWTFGDSQSSSTTQPFTHSYAASGNYTIILTTLSDKNCKDTFALNLTVHDNPISQYSIDSVCAENASTFIDNSTISSGSIVHRYFLYNDSIIGIDSLFDYTFSGYGNYPTMLVAESDFGCRDTTYNTAIVHSLPAIDITGVPRSGCQPLEVQFENHSTNIDVAISTIEWNFGDGGIATINQPRHSYLESGLFDVSFTATSLYGCINDSLFSEYIEVYPKPIADFIHDPTSADMLAPVIYFTNQTVLATNYLWNLGDGLTTNETDPVHQYPREGTYTVELIATTKDGCKDTVTGEIIIKPAFTLYVPNGFSPNNDGKNDVFQCQGIGISKFKMKIFSRWGNHVCTLNSIDEPWDGTDDGNVAQEETYIYLIEVTDVLRQIHTVTGRISIIK